ncbi:MAG: beta-ketoacyl-[acyl-carrier-protein] synthase family protein [Tannerella sp.]|jgi:3-oxoacyl-[acyl-carrier-protein] synthase-1|nr:beta-ketoacyl-[acyl-carrier-protein] synthase family protein [Tannerella sp.]
MEIVITGAGIVSALGIGKEDTYKAFVNQRSGIEPIKYLTTAHTYLPVGEVKHSSEELYEMLNIPPTEACIRSSLIAIPAVGEAMKQAKIENRSGWKVAFLSGITVGGMDKAEEYYADFLGNDSKNAYIELNDCGACTEQIADYFGGFQTVSTIVTACSSSANTIMMGADLIKTGRADIVVVGGCECLSRYHVNGFNTLMILDKELCKPFDRDRKGINLGEGAGYIVLESAENAKQRGVEPIGVLSGYFNACDAFHATASSPDGFGPYLAMKGALENAGLKPEDIDYLNAHGTGTPNNDLTEGLAIMRLFGENVPPVASIKAFTGHTTSAAGGFEAVVSILAIQNNFMPVNLNFRNRIEELKFSPVTASEHQRAVKHVLSNSFGFGGNDSAIIFSSFDNFNH